MVNTTPSRNVDAGGTNWSVHGLFESTRPSCALYRGLQRAVDVSGPTPGRYCDITLAGVDFGQRAPATLEPDKRALETYAGSFAFEPITEDVGEAVIADFEDGPAYYVVAVDDRFYRPGEALDFAPCTLGTGLGGRLSVVASDPEDVACEPAAYE